MKVRLNISRLKEIEKITQPLHKKRGGWKSLTTVIHGRKKLEKAFQEYSDFWTNLVSNLLPEYDPAKHLIRMTVIEVSPEVDDIISNILYGFSFVEYSPIRNSELKGNECIIPKDKILASRGEINDI